MKSLKRSFEALQKKRPFSSSLINFNGACRDGKFSRDKVGRWFNKLVDPEDYEGNSKREMVAYAYELSKGLNRTPNEGELPAGDEGNERHGSLDVWTKQKRKMAVIQLFVWDEIAVLDRTVIHMGSESLVG